jgi:hypothetical protein
MKRLFPFLLPVFTLIAFVLISCTKEMEEQEKTVGEKDVPKAVLKAFNDAYPGATIREYSEEIENGETSYEISCVYEGRKIDAVYMPDGSVSAIEEVIPPEELPEAVQQGISREAPQYSLKLAEKIDQGGERFYEVKILNTQDQTTYELKFSDSGKLIEKEMKKGKDNLTGQEKEEDESGEMITVPAAVASAFESRFSGAEDIEWGKESDSEFEAEFTLNGKSMSANFDTGGKWLETESKVTGEELPAAVRSTLKSDFGMYQVSKAERLEKPGEPVTFEIKMEEGGTTTEVVLDETGKVVKQKVKNEEEESEHEED